MNNGIIKDLKWVKHTIFQAQTLNKEIRSLEDALSQQLSNGISDYTTKGGFSFGVRKDGVCGIWTYSATKELSKGVQRDLRYLFNNGQVIETNMKKDLIKNIQTFLIDENFMNSVLKIQKKQKELMRIETSLSLSLSNDLNGKFKFGCIDTEEYYIWESTIPNYNDLYFCVKNGILIESNMDQSTQDKLKQILNKDK